jgi:SLA1 homology domain 1, SHD1
MVDTWILVVCLAVVLLAVALAIALSVAKHIRWRQERLEKLASLDATHEYDIIDLWKYRFVMPRATGQSIKHINADVQNLTDKPLRVVIRPGTYFVSSGVHQNMVSCGYHRFRLQPRSTEHMAAACINAELAIPADKDRFCGVASVPTDLARFLEAAQNENAMVIQAGVWALTDNYSKEEIQGKLVTRSSYGTSWPAISESEIDRAGQILDELGIFSLIGNTSNASRLERGCGLVIAAVAIVGAAIVGVRMFIAHANHEKFKTPPTVPHKQELLPSAPPREFSPAPRENSTGDSHGRTQAIERKTADERSFDQRHTVQRNDDQIAARAKIDEQKRLADEAKERQRVQDDLAESERRRAADQKALEEKQKAEAENQRKASDMARQKAIEDAKWREWVSADGNFRAEAKFVKAAGNVATLERRDGVIITVPFARLSQDDVDFIRKRKWLNAPSNP